MSLIRSSTHRRCRDLLIHTFHVKYWIIMMRTHRLQLCSALIWTCFVSIRRKWFLFYFFSFCNIYHHYIIILLTWIDCAFKHLNNLYMWSKKHETGIKTLITSLQCCTGLCCQRKMCVDLKIIILLIFIGTRLVLSFSRSKFS